jgi:Plasma-membrane choline transporter
VLLLYSSIWRQKDIKLTIDFLQEGSQCFWEFPSLGLISFVFVVLLLGLTALCGFQVLAYWSSSNMQLNPNSVYYRPNGGFAVFMTVLNIIEFIWGLSFLKEACNILIMLVNMIVSGTTVSWYFRKSHSLMFGLSNLFKFHWGSVAGGAFLLHLLYPIDIVYDIFKPSQNDHGPYRKFCCCCEKLFDLARS